MVGNAVGMFGIFLQGVVGSWTMADPLGVSLPLPTLGPGGSWPGRLGASLDGTSGISPL